MSSDTKTRIGERSIGVPELKVAIVVMPFSSADYPSLAAGLLQSGLRARGIVCDTKCFNVTFSKLLGQKAYSSFVDTPSVCLRGEWVFAQLLFGLSGSDWDSYEKEVLRHPIWGMRSQDYERVLSIRQLARMFLSMVFDCTNWGEYDIVGFTSTFEQTMPSLCLAKLIREKYPKVRLVAGGANFEAPMGRVYMKHFDFLDYVCTGEGDECFPNLCENLRAGSGIVPPGLLYRSGNEIHGTPMGEISAPVELDRLPLPDFTDFCRVFERSFPGSNQLPHLMIETSRGCWWGQRSHCTFCGLNGDRIRYRQKTWRRTAEEVALLSRRYRSGIIQFTDNILSMEYFKNLIPFWAENPLPTPKFFEVKSNLNRDQLLMLKKAGVTYIQAGIESLADNTLSVMKKGVTGAQNVALLRWSAELGIETHWNLIFGFPKEDLSDYQVSLELLRKMIHLRPPDGCAPIRMDRFSPNFTNWRENGFTEISPMPAYRHVFGFSPEDLDEIAYYFDYKHPNLERVLELARPLMSQVEVWKEKSRAGLAGELRVKPLLAGGYCLVDKRSGFTPSWTKLDDVMRVLLLECDKPSSAENATERSARLLTSTNVSLIRETFSDLVSAGVIAIVGSKAITLALLPESLRAIHLNEDIYSLERKEIPCQSRSMC
jgi:ribosomal peptide maturation radical SAM protein 1